MIKDELFDFAIAMPKRYTKIQKSIYIEALLKRFKEYGYAFELAKSTIRSKTANNVIIGNIDNAQVVLMTHYDTPTLAYNPKYKYYPFSPKANIAEEKKNSLIQILLFVLILALGLVMYWLSLNYEGWLKFCLMLLIVIFIVVAILVIKSTANKANITRNSASIALMLDIAHKDNNKKFAFLLLDKNAQSFNGLNQFEQYLEEHKRKIKGQLIYLDCIAYGSSVVVGYNQQLKEKAYEIIENYQGKNLIDKSYSETKSNEIGLNIIKPHIKVSSGEIINHEFVVTQTRSKKDVHINLKQMMDIELMLLQYVQEV